MFLVIEINYTLPGYPCESLVFTVTQTDVILKLHRFPRSVTDKDKFWYDDEKKIITC